MMCSNADGEMPKAEYDDICDELFEKLETTLLELENTDVDFDSDYSQGVLTMRLNGKTWVINKQSPNRQVWWSSPYSGPKRYGYDRETKQWLNTRDNHNMLKLLFEEVRDETGLDLSDAC